MSLRKITKGELLLYYVIISHTHNRMQGYKVVGGALETDDNYYKRISGIVRLYAAIIQYPVPKEIVSCHDNEMTSGNMIFSQPHPFGPEHGWEWLANILNNDPKSGITATALLHFLEVWVLGDWYPS